MIEERALWKEIEETWLLPKLDLAGNNKRLHRPINSIYCGLPRPETEYARKQRKSSSDPRWRYDNVIDLELDSNHYNTDPEVELESGPLRKDIRRILNINIDDQGHQINIPVETSNPYMRYTKKQDGKSSSNKDRSRRAKSPKL